jgi:integrase
MKTLKTKGGSEMGMIYKPKWKAKDGTLRESKRYWIQYCRNGQVFREGTDCARYEDAKRRLHEKEGDLAHGLPVVHRVDKVTVGELLEDLLTDYRVNGKASLKKIEGICRNHLEPFCGRWKANQVTTAQVNKYIQARQASGAENATINRELAALKRAYNLALQSRRLLFKPYVPMLSEDNVREGFFSAQQFESVSSHLPEELQPVVAFAYLTGWRTNSEILTLQWRQVDFNSGTVRLEPGSTKNKEGRVFPLRYLGLRELLEAQRAKRDALQREHGILCPWVFHRRGQPIGDFRKVWKNACKKAGVPGRIPHDFRRTAVRNLEAAGVPRSVAMKLTGHKTESVYRRYAIVSESDLSEGLAKLDRFLAEAGTIDTNFDKVAHESVQNDPDPVVPNVAANA